MTPFGHLAIAALLARLCRYDDRAFALCVAGAVAPDLVDKPLFAFDAVPVAHTVGHSVVVLGVAVALAAVGGRLRTVGPFLVGWAGHVGADLVVAYPKFLVNYAWPVLEQRPTPEDPFLAYWLEYAVGPLGVLEAGLVVSGVVAFVRWRRLRTADD